MKNIVFSWTLVVILFINWSACLECSFSYYDYPTHTKKTKVEECTTSCCYDQAKCCQETSTQTIIIGVSIGAAVLVIILLGFTILCFKNYSTRKTKVKMFEQQKENRKKKNKVKPGPAHQHHVTPTMMMQPAMSHYDPYHHHQQQQQALPGAFGESPSIKH